jgi:hypothetical protein
LLLLNRRSYFSLLDMLKAGLRNFVPFERSCFSHGRRCEPPFEKLPLNITWN